jgi:hypothetical protein
MLWLLAGWLAPASAAQAASIPVLFDGPVSGSQHYGVSAAGATAAQAAGVSLLSAPLESSRNKLLVTDQDLGSLSLDPEDLITPFEVTSQWTLENVSGLAYADDVYLVFTTADPRDVVLSTGTVTADHDETQVGLRIDGANGWVLLQTSVAGLGTLYYPAVRLGPLGVGAQAQIDVSYYLNQLLSFEDGNDTVVPLPKLRIAMAVIPEPGTGLLLGAGLLLLAARARSRS